MNGDGKDDVCGRAAAGVLCALSNGGGFDAATLGPAWSNTNGWGTEWYYGTLRYGGVAPKKSVPPNPGGGGDGGSPGSDGGTGGGGTSGCTASNAPSSSPLGWAALAMGLVMASRRRSRR
jgi:MYXO-CTERM domain-containing protein